MPNSVIKKISYIPLFFMLIATVWAFTDQYSYIGIGITNTSSGSLYNGSYSVTTYIFQTADCGGIVEYSQVDTVDIDDGDFGVIVNHSNSDENVTFYIRSSVAGDNQTCFRYTPAAQAGTAKNATDSAQLSGYTSTSLPIAGDVTGTLGVSSVTSLTLNAIAYSGTLGYRNITLCSANEILKVIGSDWACAADNDTDTDTDTINVYSWLSNFTDDVGYYKTEANLTALLDDNYIANNSGQWNINISCTNIQGGSDGDYCADASAAGGGNSTEEMIFAVNNTALNASSFVSIPCSNIVFDNGIGTSAICDGDDAAGAGSYDLNVTSDSGSGVILDSEILTFTGAGLVSTAHSGNTLTITGTSDNTNTNVTSIAVTGTTTKTINLEQTGLSNLTATFTDIDTDTDTINIYTWLSNFTDDVGYYKTEANLTGLLDDNYIATGTSLGNSTQEIRDAVNASITFDFSSSDLVCTNCIDGTEIAELTDADISNTLTASILTDDDTYATTASAETFDEAVTFSKNITVEAVHLETDVALHHISDNSTCVIIKGDTATLNIC